MSENNIPTVAASDELVRLVLEFDRLKNNKHGTSISYDFGHFLGQSGIRPVEFCSDNEDIRLMVAVSEYIIVRCAFPTIETLHDYNVRQEARRAEFKRKRDAFDVRMRERANGYDIYISNSGTVKRIQPDPALNALDVLRATVGGSK